jgi:hypothetical protein
MGCWGICGQGAGRALVVRGEAGVGKSALLAYAAGAAGMRVARAAGVESEMELAFASVHQLCTPLLDRLEGLPGPQRDALEAAAELLAIAAAGPLEELGQARAALLRGQVAFASGDGDAPALLVKAARQLEPLDAVLARQTYLDAWLAAVFAGRFAVT